MYSTAYLSTADWNDTRTKSPELDAMILAARSETDTAKRTELYAKIAMFVQEESGLICPMFNDFIDSYSDKVAGYMKDPNFEAMGGWASAKTWFA